MKAGPGRSNANSIPLQVNHPQLKQPVVAAPDTINIHDLHTKQGLSFDTNTCIN